MVKQVNSVNDIKVQDAVVNFFVPNGKVRAVDHVSLVFRYGEITGIIGESGCGKSVLGLSILGLLPPYAEVSGQILYQNQDLMALCDHQMRKIRGRQIGWIPQNPNESLNPVIKIKRQIKESLRLTRKSSQGGDNEIVSLLQRFGFQDSIRVSRSYPFELSGGMQQRVTSAMGIACSPKWVIADEPTKGLDKALREQTCDTLASIKNQGVKGMIIITHDIELAKKLCDSVAVMYSGQILEKGENVVDKPLHPYTQALIASLPENGMNVMPGSAPAPGEDFIGCRFAPRCKHCMEQCTKQSPMPFYKDGGMVRCFLYD